MTLRTVAGGEMVDDSAFSVIATQSGARIATFLVNADLSGSAVRVKDTLRLTTLAGVAEIFRQALTNCRSRLFATNSVGTTG